MEGEWQFYRETSSLWQFGHLKIKRNMESGYDIIKIMSWNMMKNLWKVKNQQRHRTKAST